MKKYIVYLSILSAIAASSYYVGTSRAQPALVNNMSTQHCNLRTDMRKLWSDHVWWTRDYIITAIADMPDLKATTDRLLKNQDDIGAAIVPYYGKEAGEKLAALLKEHILLAADVVAAAKANNTTKLKEADTKWHTNADAIALFLSNANPNWPKETIQEMMYEHLKLTTQEAVARLKKDWTTDIETFEKVFNEIMIMADSLTTGITKQFPEKF